MGYQVLSRPEGTEAYKKSTLSTITDTALEGLRKGLEKGKQESKDTAIREAIKQGGLKPKYKKDAEGRWSEEWDSGDDMKEFEQNIKRKISKGEKLTREEENYHNTQMISSSLRVPYKPLEPEEALMSKEPAAQGNPLVNWLKNLIKKPGPESTPLNIPANPNSTENILGMDTPEVSLKKQAAKDYIQNTLKLSGNDDQVNLFLKNNPDFK